MKVWRMDNNRYDRMQEELRQSKSLDLPVSWKGPLAQLDEKTGEFNVGEETGTRTISPVKCAR
jgi:hypothetical protein